MEAKGRKGARAEGYMSDRRDVLTQRGREVSKVDARLFDDLSGPSESRLGTPAAL